MNYKDIMNQQEKDIFFSYSKTQMSNWNKYGKRNMIDDYDIEAINYINKIPVWLMTSVVITFFPTQLGLTFEIWCEV